MTKDLGYIAQKINKAGIDSVVTVRDSGLEFLEKSTSESIASAQTIFDNYKESDSIQYNLAHKIINLKSQILAIQEVKKEIVIPDNIDTEYDNLYTILVEEFNKVKL